MKVVLTPNVYTQLTGIETTDAKDLDDLLDEWWGPVGSPVKAEADVARMRRRSERAARLTSWMRRIPLIGYLASVFWYDILDEGIVATCQPHWGGLTFAFLNDGVRPTLWHTWQNMTHWGEDDPGLYVTANPTDGKARPPRSRAEADAWEKYWAEARRRREEEQTGI